MSVPTITNEWSEWRCPWCNRLQQKHVVVGAAIIETKCWNCRKKIRLRLSPEEPDVSFVVPEAPSKRRERASGSRDPTD